MRRLVRVVTLLLAVVLFIGVTPAQAGWDGVEVAFEGPAAPLGPPLDRCPDNAEWTFGTLRPPLTPAPVPLAGSIQSAVYDGEVTVEFEHCSRWLLDRLPQPSFGMSEAGLMTIAAAGEGTLTLSYEGPWVFTGAPPDDFWFSIYARYRVIGGEGVFEDASGRGWMVIRGDTVIDGIGGGLLHMDR